MGLLKYLIAYEIGLFIVGVIIIISIIIIAINSIIIAKRLKKIIIINENKYINVQNEENHEQYQSLWASRKQ